MSSVRPRHFVLMQGPHGPFFGQLARHLRRSGADVTRICFNAGDRAFSGRAAQVLAWTASDGDWATNAERTLQELGATDVVVYGETRPRHRAALEAARRLGLRTHILEEGYLRPYWITYERHGSNAASPVTRLSIAEIAARLDGAQADHRRPPDRWGDLLAHVFWGASYHAALMAGARAFPAYVSHRDGPVTSELGRYLRRISALPVRRIRRRLVTRSILKSGQPFHLALLQLAHDANFRDHGAFPDQHSFLDAVMKGFAVGAPSHHVLVIKSHPLEDGRVPLAELIATLAQKYKVEGRVKLVDGGKLARLLDDATSAVTVNSSAGQQVLWRGLPLRSFGVSVYDKPELVSSQPLQSFFAAPVRPDADAYAAYRAFLLQTSQIQGGFYAANARRKLLRRLADVMLSDADLYDRTENIDAARSQHLASV